MEYSARQAPEDMVSSLNGGLAEHVPQCLRSMDAFGVTSTPENLDQ